MSRIIRGTYAEATKKKYTSLIPDRRIRPSASWTMSMSIAVLESLTDSVMAYWDDFGVAGKVFGAASCVLESWKLLDGLGNRFVAPGVLLGRSGSRCRELAEAPGVLFTRSGGALERSWADLGWSWGHPGTLLTGSWGILGGLGAI